MFRNSYIIFQYKQLYVDSNKIVYPVPKTRQASIDLKVSKSDKMSAVDVGSKGISENLAQDGLKFLDIRTKTIELTLFPLLQQVCL